ncbi:MAG: hypothetical protein NT078_00770 [Candidatus Azambacteria bacterium]|nr:hypothetical protein [Candidatus Azambacteria bacterium]
MPELTREEKFKLVEKLPQRLQDLFYSEDTGVFLLYLGQKYNLPDEKIRLLSKLVGDVVLGIVSIASLTQEINSKITSDAQAAMNLAQELNTELLAPAMAAPNIPPTPTPPAAPTTPLTPTVPSADHYREPTAEAPQIIDLRKTPVTPAQSAPSVAPSVPVPKPIIPTQPIVPKPVIPVPPAAPTAPLIEAEPHKILTPTPKPIDAYREPTKTQSPPLVSAPIPTSTPPASEPKPQYIMRPSGAPPTDLPDNVLDLRKDKGEF